MREAPKSLPGAKWGVSVVLCCHNSAARIGKTLEHLKAQTLPRCFRWEVIIVDNGSTDGTSAKALEFWGRYSPVPLRIVCEPKLGLSHARVRGIGASRFELISFVDDDNWLSPRWVAQVEQILASRPSVGACGGATIAAYDAGGLPDWFAVTRSSYAVGQQYLEAGDVTWRLGHLWGAGLTLRRSAWNSLVTRGFVPTLGDRAGMKLSSGGDYEICYALRLAGWRLWYDPDLTLEHFIPESRLTLEYLSRLKVGFGAQTIGHDPYRLFVSFPADQVKGMFGRIWLRLLLREIAIAVFRDRTYWHWFRTGVRDRLTAKMHWLVHLGRISALWGSRHDYDHRVRSFRASGWINISRPLANFFTRHPEMADAAAASRVISPTVSVIICNYNYSRYLSSAIDSVLAQTWKKLDIIVVDDGSTDNSRDILKSYSGRVRVVLKENGGQASAFNAGIRSAVGDIICFLDSDDLWQSEKVERVVEAYREFPWALNCHDLSLVDECGNGLTQTKIHFEEPQSRILGDSFEAVQKNGYRWMFRPTSALSIRADVAKAIVPIPEEDWRISADSPLAFSATCSGPVSFLPEILGSYRIHGDNRYATSHLASSSVHVMRNLVRPVERYLLMKSRETCRRRGPMLSPNTFYPEYRKRVFVAHPRPATMIPSLVAGCFAYYVLSKAGVVRPWLMFVRYTVVDIAVALMISVRLPIRYTSLRREFREFAQGLRPEVLQHLFIK